MLIKKYNVIYKDPPWQYDVYGNEAVNSINLDLYKE